MERDTAAGLNLAVFREENPGTERWDTQDPLGLRGLGANLYVYAGNGPANLIDPSGLSGITFQGPWSDNQRRRIWDAEATILWKLPRLINQVDAQITLLQRLPTPGQPHF
jgi:RHS repeat-associated protein